MQFLHIFNQMAGIILARLTLLEQNDADKR